MTKQMTTEMMAEVESGVLEVSITNRMVALVYHSKATDADYDVVRFDRQTCTCATFRTHLVCAHLSVANRELATLQMIDLHDGAEYGSTGCDPFAEF